MSADEQPVVRPKSLAAAEQDERPAIHVGLTPGLSSDHFRWVAIGAEEEGVPCRQIAAEISDPVALAYEAAMSSRFGVGVGVSPEAVVLHELHMPPSQPVLRLAAGPEFLRICRLAGSNAARLIIRLPLRFELEPETPVVKPKRTTAPVQPPANNPAASPDLDPALIRAIARAVVKILQSS